MIFPASSLVLALSSGAILDDNIQNNQTHYLKEIDVQKILMNNPKIVHLQCLRDKHIRQHQEIQNIISENRYNDYSESNYFSDFSFTFDFSIDIPETINFNIL